MTQRGPMGLGGPFACSNSRSPDTGDHPLGYGIGVRSSVPRSDRCCTQPRPSARVVHVWGRSVGGVDASRYSRLFTPLFRSSRRHEALSCPVVTVWTEVDSLCGTCCLHSQN